MNTDRCPGCAGKRIRRSASWLKHVVRTLLASDKRFCRDCKKRWRRGEQN